MSRVIVINDEKPKAPRTLDQDLRHSDMRIMKCLNISFRKKNGRV